MHKRDWAGAVLVACLIAAAGLLQDHTVLLVLLAIAALISSAVILWDVAATRRQKTRLQVESPRGAAEPVAERLDERSRQLKVDTRNTVANAMDRFIREIETWRADIPTNREGPGPLISDEQQGWIDGMNDLRNRVAAALRQDAPGLVSYWRTDPPSRSPLEMRPTRASMDAEVAFELEQLRHIAARLREGHDEP